MTTPAFALCSGLHSPLEEARYLRSLNACFPGWGDRRMFDWCFSRTVAGLQPDILQLASGDAVIAGSAVTYRRLRLANGAFVTAGIMTGSWTLPEARGAGAFTALIEASRHLTAERGGALLLAFVTASNPSRRRLQLAGASVWPTFYCRSSASRGEADTHVRELPTVTQVVDTTSPPSAGVHFSYTADEWTGQFRDRPHGTHVVGRPGCWAAVVEHVTGFDRVHALQTADGWWPRAMAALTARAAGKSRELFVFTTRAQDSAVLRECGFAVTDGFVAALPANHDALTGALQHTGLVPEGGLAVHGSPWHLGEWALQNGDRM